MDQWVLRWNFDKSVYQPGESGRIHFWLENTGSNHLHIEKTWLQFDWQGDQAYYSQVNRQVPPKNNYYLTSLQFDIPSKKAGMITYSVGLDFYEYISYTSQWQKLPQWWSGHKYFIKSIPMPYYRAFVSRGLKPEERIATNPIVEMIKEWGFGTRTVGIEVFSDPNLIDQATRDEIKRSDCFVAIATKRYLDALSGMWRTFEWLHGETGIAFGLDRPLLVIIEKGVVVEGLPGYLVSKGRYPSVEFDPLNTENFRGQLDAVMPSFRECIASKKSEEFWNAIARAVPLLILGGIFGYALGSSRR